MIKKFFSDLFIENTYIIINPITILNDIKNYLYTRKKVKEFKYKKFWEDYKCRVDWFGMPYLVINYTDSFFLETENNQKSIIVTDLALIFQEFYNVNCHEIVILKQERIVENGIPTNAILFYFRPMFWNVSFKSFFNSLLLYGGLTYYFFFL